MSFEPPDGILDIGNATLRVGKLEVAETSGLNQGLLNIVKNNLLITENTEYAIDHHWGIKLPTTWVADFDVKGHSGKYVEFNFYNEDKTSNTSGYTLNFNDTTLSLRYDNGSWTTATIPTIVNTYRKVNIFFERNVIAVSIDGTRVLYYKHAGNPPPVMSRVISTTGSAFVNVFIEQDAANSKFKNLRIVNGRFISDQTSNIAFIGGNLGVGVNSPTESLDVLGSIKSSANLHVSGNVYAGGEIELYSNLNIQQVSNTATIKATSNVVAEFSRSKKFMKFPRLLLTYAAQSSQGGYENYVVNQSSVYSSESGHGAYLAFRGNSQWLSSSNSFDGAPDRFNDVNGPWISIQLPTKIKLEYLEFSAASGRLAQLITAGSVYASNDGSTWINIGSLDNLGTYTNIVPAHVDFTHTTLYDRYLLHVTANVTGYVHMEKLSLFGVPEYDPEAHGTDVTVKSVPNVPNMDWLEVYYDGQDYTSMPTTVTDKSGNNRTGTPTSVGFDTEYKAFTFNGSSSGISTTSTATLSNHTASMWIKFDSPAAWEAVYAIRPVSGTSDRNNAVLYVGNNYFRLESVGNTGPYFDFDYYFVTGKWVHLTLVFRGTGLEDAEMYINNVKLRPSGSKRSATDDITITGTNTVSVGIDPGSYYLDGSIANFRLFNRALSSDEIYQLYAYQKEYFGLGDLSMTLKAGRLNAPSGGIVYPRGRTVLDYYEETNVENWATVVSGTTANIHTNTDGRILYQRIGNFCTVHFPRVAMYVVGSSAYLVSKVPERFQPLSDPGDGDILHFPTRAVSNSGFEVMYYYNDANNQWVISSAWPNGGVFNGGSGTVFQISGNSVTYRVR